MSSKRIASFTLALVILLLVMASCSTVGVYQSSGKGIGHGPPAHAKAHGYRRKQIAGVELIFDSGLGLYVVSGHPDHYYHDGHFYRLHGSIWEISLRPDGGWSCVSVHSLPRGLHTKQTKAKGKSKNIRAAL